MEVKVEAPIRRLQEFLDEALRDNTRIEILEAGCGSASHVVFRSETHITGIDISRKQLDRNVTLHEKILGDLQSHEFEPDSFDLILCWDVLEHLANPDQALERFFRAARPGGLILLKFPNLLSVKGMLTRCLPYRAHVWFYRYLHGQEDTGKEESGPFRTYLRGCTTASGIKALAERNNASVAYFDTYDAGDLSYFLRKSLLSRFARGVYLCARKSCRLLSLGKIGDSELIIVLRKGETERGERGKR